MANKSPKSQEPQEPSQPASGALGEISQGPGAFELFLDQHHMKLLFLGIAAVIAVAGYMVNEGIKEGRETAGGNALHQAEDLPSLQAVLKNHDASRAAGSAAVLLADKQWDEDQQDAAIATLRTFIDTSGDHPAKATARASLGSKLASQGKAGEAAEVFRALADDRTNGAYLAPFALIGLGDLAQAAGNRDEAETHYTRVRTEFATSPFSDSASQRLQLLKADMPVEIDPPAPVEAPPVTPAPVTPAPDAPAPDAPAPDAPAPDASTPDAPTPDVPEPDAPVPAAPDAPAPDAPTPDAPTPPAPDAPEPDAPEPDAPQPDAPQPDAPQPDAPAPDAPAPDAPAPDAPAPDAPAPDAPAPESPEPDAPAPDAPEPDAPAPDAPEPDAPAPEEDAPEEVTEGQ